MQSAWSACQLPGVWRRSLTAHADARGSFTELWRASWSHELPAEARVVQMAQANVSRSASGVLRGLHFHQRQEDFWVALDGRAFVGLVDLRPLLEGGNRPSIETLELETGDALYIPQGVAHGFYAPEPLTLVYMVSNEYDGTDEHGFAWNDDVAGVPWPTSSPILSERDASNPSLAAAIAPLRSD